MKIVGVEPRDIHVIVDFSIKELDMILEVLERSEVDPGTGEDKERIEEALEYVKGQFVPVFDQLVEESKKEIS